MDSLVFRATLQAVCLSSISNFLAQCLAAYQDGRPLDLDTTQLFRFACSAVLNCPPNVLWQTWLEETFPGYTSATDPGTTESLSKRPAVRSVTDRATPVLQSVNEKAGPALQTLNDKTAAVATAIADNETVKVVSRRVTDGVDTVRSKAREIDGKYRAPISDKLSRKASLAGAPTDASLPKTNTITTSDGDDYTLADQGTDDGVSTATMQKWGGEDVATLQDPVQKQKVKKRLNVRNTAIKFALDQTFGALYNTVAFIVIMAALRGDSADKIFADVMRDTLPLIFAGQKLWPAVSIISFTLVPLEYRTAFGGIVGIGWGIYLSLFAGKKVK